MSRESTALLAIAAYALLCHWRSSTAPDQWSTALIMLGPLVVALTLSALRAPRVVAAISVAAIVAACVSVVLLFDRSGVARWLYVVQHVSVNGLLGVTFGMSLVRPRVALITLIARRIHGDLPLEIERYTRSVTLAWTVYFAITCIASIVVFVSAPIEQWSRLANLGSPIGIAVMFLGDFALRRWLYPHWHHVGLLEAIRAGSLPSRKERVSS